ncbi:anti-sigma factor [Mycolicibacterium helvum]|uniref:Anti-sigma-K factor RskA n=1 Tax=Mycolicibacterium helvum TaxID=1534349 RepID=A0A7I7TD47_9MYCO|nr:anti-sigma factor [Mycolicibacterium helvum]BBY66076.1 anti-sigma-K factor RskA [Mycolicibacterium helvum]
MTGPADLELLALATPYALNAVSDAERADIERRLDAAPAAVVEHFHDEVRSVRETMAALSASTRAEPPPELRERLLAAVGPAQNVQKPRRTTILLAAAAALVVALVAVGVGLALRPPPQRSTAEQVISAPDMHTVSAAIPSGGIATVVYSRDKNAAVLVMNDVNPPPPGSVYQMWLLGGQQPRSAGTMTPENVGPSTTAVLADLQTARALAFTVEPGNGSPQPTTQPFAELPLT